MFFITPAATAGLVVCAAIALAVAGAPVKQCPWGHCDEEEITYMNLLQVRADSQISKDALSVLKNIHPYYHTSAEIQDRVAELSKGCGGAMTVQKLSDSGVDIEVVHVKAPKSSPVNKVFILFGEHSRELISPESGLRLLEMLCGKEVAEGAPSASSILQDSEFQLVLNGNPSSRKSVEGGEYCLRTNPNGVDLNRNWDEKWSENDDMGSGTNPGPRPFSEPETRIFKGLVEKFKPTTFLTVHSGTRGMYMPWAYDMKHAASYNAPLMLSVLKDLDKSHCQCPYGAAGKEVGYPCPGTCLDWVYDRLKTPYVFAFEIYTSADRDSDLKRRWDEKVEKGALQLLQSGNHLGHGHFADLYNEHSSDFVQRRSNTTAQSRDENEECFNMFNPNSEELYKTTVNNWAVAYLEMSAMIAKQVKKDSSTPI